MLLHVQLDGSERVIALAEFEERVRDGTLGPETPVRSEPLTGDRWVPAGDLEIFRGIRASPEVRVRQALASAAVPWFTALLVGVEFRIFFWTQYTPVQAWLWDRFTKYTPAIVEGDQHWRLLSYGFLHGDAGHIGMNMLLIAYLGIALESVIGAFSLAVLFTSSVFWGGVLSALLAPDSPSVGASGGDFGFLAAAAVFGLRYGNMLPPRARSRFGVIMLIYLIYFFISSLLAPKVDNWGHLGGLLAGGAHMALLRPNVGPVWVRRNRMISFIVLLLGFVGVVGMARLAIPLVPVEEDGLTAERPVWWTEGWAATGDRAWISPVDGGQLVARTLHHEGPSTLADATADLLASFREVDAGAVVTTEGDVTKDGVPGRSLHLTYTNAGRARRVDAVVYVRGAYESRLVLDVPEGQGRVARLWERLVDGFALTVPADVAKARAATGGWRGRLHQAEGAAQLGDVAGARALIDTALREAPGEPAPRLALLDLLADYPDPTAVSQADAALLAWPTDRKVLEAAVRALVAAGQPDLARARLDARIAAAPEDRKLLRLRDELFADAVTPPAPPP